MRLEPLPILAPDPFDNPSSKLKVDLGRLLFFDPVLSSKKDVSCATCHHPRFGWGDGRGTPIGVGGSGLGPSRVFMIGVGVPPILRNVPTLLNVGFNGILAGGNAEPSNAPMFWDSRVRSLEAQAFIPLWTIGEMCAEGCSEPMAMNEVLRRLRAIKGYVDRFREAFNQPPGEPVTIENIAKAIAAFERSLVTPATAVDRFLRGETAALTEDQQHGLKVFQSAGCVHCHGGPMLSDYKMHFIGLPDTLSRNPRAFRTPTLRNLRHTAPYMHDGSLRTLREVMVFYEGLSEAVSESLDGGDENLRRLDPLLKHLDLGQDDFASIEAFLDALSSNDYNQSVPETAPSGLPVLR